MPYRKAYFYGDNENSAFVGLKLNELSHKNVIEKTNIYKIKKPRNIRCKLFEKYFNYCINHDLKRKKTSTEKKAINYLNSVFGYQDFIKIMNIYNTNGPYVLVYELNNESDYTDLNIENNNKLKCYRFLY